MVETGSSNMTHIRTVIDGKDRPFGLSPFEMEILAHIADGRRPAEIGEIVGSSRNAVDNRLNDMKNKLGANTTGGMVARAFRVGILK